MARWKDGLLSPYMSNNRKKRKIIERRERLTFTAQTMRLGIANLFLKVWDKSMSADGSVLTTKAWQLGQIFYSGKKLKG